MKRATESNILVPKVYDFDRYFQLLKDILLNLGLHWSPPSGRGNQKSTFCVYNLGSGLFRRDGLTKSK
jgi:hypothetical protein